jgi:hypothetical protein
MQIIFIFVLILIWQMSRQRHLVIIKDIEKIIYDTNPATQRAFLSKAPTFLYLIIIFISQINTELYVGIQHFLYLFLPYIKYPWAFFLQKV